MNPVLFITGPLLGFVGMLSGGYWGVGCGWIVVPVLLILGFEPLDAVGIGLLQMVPSTLLTVMRQAPEIGWKPGEPGRSLAIPVGIGALLTSLCGKTINHRLYELCGAAPLQWMLIGLITFIAVQTLCSRTRCYNDTMPPVTPFRSRIAFATGLVTGLVSSLLGVGGGLLIRPLLTSGFQVPEYYTSRIVRLLVLVTTVTGGITYLVSATGFNWQMFGAAMLIAVGGIVGFPLGARLHRIVYDNGYAQHIHKSFAVVAVALLTSTLCSIFGLQAQSRVIMIGIAVLLMVYLGLFALYTKKHPREIIR